MKCINMMIQIHLKVQMKPIGKCLSHISPRSNSSNDPAYLQRISLDLKKYSAYLKVTRLE